MPGTVPEDESMIDAQLVEDQDAEQNEEFEEEDEEAEFIADDHQRITIVSFVALLNEW